MDIFVCVKAYQAPGVDAKRYTHSLNLTNQMNGAMMRVHVNPTDTLESIKLTDTVLNMFSEDDRKHIVYVLTNFNGEVVNPTATFGTLGLKQGSNLEVYVSIR
jgi:hypothetical protein